MWPITCSVEDKGGSSYWQEGCEDVISISVGTLGTKAPGSGNNDFWVEARLGAKLCLSINHLDHVPNFDLVCPGGGGGVGGTCNLPT